MSTHISLGALVLVLVVLRLLRAFTRRGQGPRHEGPTAPFVRIGHGLLYACMVLLPVTGILYMVGNGYALSVFGAQLVAETEVEIPWMIALGAYHSPIALLFLALVVGHILITLYHHFIRKDDTLLRMWS